jgi:hypothetical protein
LTDFKSSINESYDCKISYEKDLAGRNELRDDSAKYLESLRKYRDDIKQEVYSSNILYKSQHKQQQNTNLDNSIDEMAKYCQPENKSYRNEFEETWIEYLESLRKYKDEIKQEVYSSNLQYKSQLKQQQNINLNIPLEETAKCCQPENTSYENDLGANNKSEEAATQSQSEIEKDTALIDDETKQTISILVYNINGLNNDIENIPSKITISERTLNNINDESIKKIVHILKDLEKDSAKKLPNITIPVYLITFNNNLSNKYKNEVTKGK